MDCSVYEGKETGLAAFFRTLISDGVWNQALWSRLPAEVRIFFLFAFPPGEIFHPGPGIERNWPPWLTFDPIAYFWPNLSSSSCMLLQ